MGKWGKVCLTCSVYNTFGLGDTTLVGIVDVVRANVLDPVWRSADRPAWTTVYNMMVWENQ